MLFHLNLNKLISTLNWLFVLFPISFILGNLIINLHVLIFVLLGCIYLKKKNVKYEKNFFLLTFLLFCLILIISSIYNQSNIEKSLLFFRIFIFYYICLLLLKEKLFNFKKIFNLYSIIVLIICLDLIIQYFIGYNIIGLEIKPNGATSFFGNERVAGSFVQNFGFFLIFTIFTKFKKKNITNEILKSFLIALIGIAIFVSAQRMPSIIWLFFLTIYGLIYYKSKLKNILFSFLILGVFISCFFSTQDNERYVSFFTNAKTILEKTLIVYKINSDEKKLDKIKSHLEKQNLIKKGKDLEFVKGSGHANLYGNALLIWKNNKLLGIGYKNFYNICQKKKLLRCSTHPHNYYLDILVTVGIIGFLIFITYLIIISLKAILSLKFYYKEKENEKFNLTFIFFLNFLMVFFPLKSSGSFFTTSNITYTIIILALLTSQLINKSKKIL